MQLFRIASRIACVMSFFAATLPACAGTITVNSTAAPSASFCTLGQAIYAANLANNPTDATPFGATTIAPLSDSVATTVGIGTCAGAAAGDNTIDLATYAGQTITFSIDAPDNFWYGPNALPPIASTITIEGHGATLFIQNGTSPRLRFFFVGADAASGLTPGYNTPGPGNLTLHNLTLTGGRQQGGNGGFDGGGGGGGLGGAIYNQGTLTVSAVTLTGNTATGGSANDGTLVGTGSGGMGENSLATYTGGGMGGAVPSGTGQAGNAGGASNGGAGGGSANGTAGAGGAWIGKAGGSDGDGGGGGSGYYNEFGGAFSSGGGGGFGGGFGGFGGGAGGSAGGGFGGGGFGGGGGGVGGGGGGGGGFGGGGGGGGLGGGGGGGLGGGQGGGGGFGAGGGTGASGGFGGGGGGGGGAGMGGAIFNHAGTLFLINATLTANSATGGNSYAGAFAFGGSGGSGYGGAIFNLNGDLRISFSTLAFNTVTGGNGDVADGGANGDANGGEIYTLGYNGNASTGSTISSVGLSNTIVANSSGGIDLLVDAPANVVGGLVNTALARALNYYFDFGPNLVMASSSIHNAAPQPTWPFTTDPLLGVLASNHASNAPFTLALLAGSPATHTADCFDFDNIARVPVDERGSLRPTSGCDLGAYDGERIFANGFQSP